jgi:hypothetical protein
METATGKSGFLLYHDQRAFFCLLNDAEAKALILAVFDYEAMRTEPGPISPAADMAFVAIRQTLDRNRVKHDAIVERRREYGRLGGLAKASLSQQELAKPSKASYTDTVTVTDTVTDSEINIGIGIPIPSLPGLPAVEGTQGKADVSKKPRIQKTEDPLRWVGGDKMWDGIKGSDYEKWQAAYPAVELDTELVKMDQWLQSNPTKAKKKQWRKFVTGWFNRAQEKGGR